MAGTNVRMCVFKGKEMICLDDILSWFDREIASATESKDYQLVHYLLFQLKGFKSLKSVEESPDGMTLKHHE